MRKNTKICLLLIVICVLYVSYKAMSIEAPPIDYTTVVGTYVSTESEVKMYVTKDTIYFEMLNGYVDDFAFGDDKKYLYEYTGEENVGFNQVMMFENGCTIREDKFDCVFGLVRFYYEDDREDDAFTVGHSASSQYYWFTKVSNSVNLPKEFRQ